MRVRDGALDCDGPTNALVPSLTHSLTGLGTPRSSWHPSSSKFGSEKYQPTDRHQRANVTLKKRRLSLPLPSPLFCLFAPPSFCVRATTTVRRFNSRPRHTRTTIVVGPNADSRMNHFVISSGKRLSYSLVRPRKVGQSTLGYESLDPNPPDHGSSPSYEHNMMRVDEILLASLRKQHV